MADKIDPHNSKEGYMRWKEKSLTNGISGLTNANSQIVIQYLQDMEYGLNVATTNKKGGRSYLRLKSLSSRMTFLARSVQQNFSANLLELEEVHLFSFFADMRNGSIRKINGTPYKNVGDYVKDIKAFWHWHMKINRKKGVEIKDITVDLDSSRDKPDWVYLTENQIKQLCANASYKYEVLIWFLFDTGIRAPTELVNVKVSDFFNDFKELNIREEVSKTFGRRIKLMLCSDLIKDYVKTTGLKVNDYLFSLSSSGANKYLKSLAKKILGEGISPAGQKYSELTLYDFRHNSCCYWLPRYKSESALKYRFGWKKSEKIHYYTEFLGMRDTITQDDMLVDVTKTELERRINKNENEISIRDEKIADLNIKISNVDKLMRVLFTVLTDEQRAEIAMHLNAIPQT